MAWMSSKSVLLARSALIGVFCYAFLTNPKIVTENSVVVLLSASMEMDHVRTDGNVLVGIVALLAALLSLTDLMVSNLPNYHDVLHDIFMTRLLIYFLVLGYAFFFYNPIFSNSVLFIFCIGDLFFHFTALNFIREERNEHNKIRLRARFEEQNKDLIDELKDEVKF